VPQIDLFEMMDEEWRAGMAKKRKAMRKTKSNRRKAARKSAKNERAERELEEGLRETFPGSDPLAITDPTRSIKE